MQLDALIIPPPEIGSVTVVGVHKFVVTVMTEVREMLVDTRFAPLACAVAVIVADPAPTAVTTPLTETVAIAVLLV